MALIEHGGTENVSRNYSGDPGFSNIYKKTPIIFWSFLSVETFLIIFANFMLCWLFLTNRKLRTQQNYFVLSLSISDLLVGLCIGPCEYCALKKTQMQDLNCPLFCGSVLSFNMLASVVNLVLIAMDRYCSIKMPFRYQEILSKRRAIIIILISWVVTFIITLLPLSWILNFTLSPSKQMKINIIFTQTLFGGIFVVGITLGIIYYTIVKTIREKLRSVKEKSSNPAGIKVCILVAISFFICWIPTCIVEYLIQNGMKLPYGVSHATYFIMLINPCLDPILYAYYRTDFRHELSTWSQRQWKRIKNLYDRLINSKQKQIHTNNNYKGINTLVTFSIQNGTSSIIGRKNNYGLKYEGTCGILKESTDVNEKTCMLRHSSDADINEENEKNILIEKLTVV